MKTDGELLRDNWNRISELASQIKTEMMEREIAYRISLQNLFSCGQEEESIKLIKLLDNEG